MRDNPQIRHSHGEQREINLNQDYEVRHALKVGAIKVEKDTAGNGEVFHVPGKSEVVNGKLEYVQKKGKRIVKTKTEAKAKI
ncbi:MAG: hypothetical protein ACYC7D_10415 [Nitrososphaerales archaeon]